MTAHAPALLLLGDLEARRHPSRELPVAIHEPFRSFAYDTGTHDEGRYVAFETDRKQPCHVSLPAAQCITGTGEPNKYMGDSGLFL